MANKYLFSKKSDVFPKEDKSNCSNRPRPPLITNREVCEELNINYSRLNRLLFLHDGPKKRVHFGGNRTSYGNTYYDKPEMMLWIKKIKELKILD